MHEETKIEMKLEEETKPIKKLCEKIMESLTSEFEKGVENVDTNEVSEAVDMVKDLYEAKEKIVKACYYKYILAAMEKEETEEQEYKKVMEKMREEYDSEEDDMERRYYRGQPRSRTTGRFMRRGRGRRGYENMPMLMPDYDYDMSEYYRDMDMRGGRMYYSGNMNGRSGGSSSNSNNNGRNSNSGENSNSGYSDGYNDGNRRGYEDGYRDGENRGRNSQSRDSREGKSGRSRRAYMETKETHRDNSPESKQKKMKELEEYMTELSGDITEMIADASPEERALLAKKLQMLTQKVN